jgi:uncharacterized membrane-anchored protein YhcB (DUF1043 family)
VIRFLLGVLVGIVATVYFFQTGGGDYLISSSPKVRHLEEQLQRADQQQDNLAKKLEETTAVLEKMTTQFTSLEQRFQTLSTPQHKPEAEKPLTAERPSASTPDSGSIPEPPKASPPSGESGAGAPSGPPSPM